MVMAARPRAILRKGWTGKLKSNLEGALTIFIMPAMITDKSCHVSN